jgi:hypothetical protein
MHRSIPATRQNESSQAVMRFASTTCEIRHRAARMWSTAIWHGQQGTVQPSNAIASEI